MKWLLVLLVVLAGVWWLRHSGRARSRPSSPDKSADPSSRQRSASAQIDPQLMARCAHCGVHLPQIDAIHGPRGEYCSVEHRQLHEAANP
jgi:uncharacterized protein